MQSRVICIRQPTGIPRNFVAKIIFSGDLIQLRERVQARSPEMKPEIG
jgi:hypothetical protein